MASNKPRIVTIGGGTGNFTLLSELKKWTSNITALVGMADDGGSTGLLRDQLGVLPPGDIRQCLVALSESSKELRDLFNYRFIDGDFSGHSFGNLFLSAVEKLSNGDFIKAIEVAGSVLGITGKVLPVTTTNCRLAMDLDNKIIKGEYAIGHTIVKPEQKPDLWLEPTAELVSTAHDAILGADLIVIAPGNLYGSLIPALLPKGMRETLSAAKAPKVYVCNLVNLPSLPDFTVDDYITELERYAGVGIITHVLHNTAKPTEEQIKKYTEKGEYIISNSGSVKSSYKIIPGSYLSHMDAVNDHADVIARNLIRHDAQEVRRALVDILEN